MDATTIAIGKNACFAFQSCFSVGFASRQSVTIGANSCREELLAVISNTQRLYLFYNETVLRRLVLWTSAHILRVEPLVDARGKLLPIRAHVTMDTSSPAALVWIAMSVY
jgi:hypothetical protein